MFECFDREGKYRALAGGGRYDELVGLFGGEETPATGFGIGFTTLTLVLTEKKLLPLIVTGPDYYVAPIGELVLMQATELANKLREKHTVDMDMMRRKLPKQFDYANYIGAKKIIIVGEKDLADGNVTVRELATGKEEKVKLAALLK